MNIKKEREGRVDFFLRDKLPVDYVDTVITSHRVVPGYLHGL